MPTPNTPVVNAGYDNIQGLAISNNDTTPDEIVDLAAGQCRDSSDTNDIVLSAAVDIRLLLLS